MIDRLAALVVDEGKWLTLSMLVAAWVGWVQWRRPSRTAAPRARIEAALTLYFALTIAVMAFGHLAAVTVKLALDRHNLPLAVPGIVALAYRGHTRPLAGRILLGVALVAIVGLWVGSLVFMASGRNFEPFRGRR
jgi:hypothetical protein